MTRPCKCGECAFFKNEEMSGLGHCIITRDQTQCNLLCEFAEEYMTKAETLRALHHYQKWRRGGNGKAPHPFVIGKVIDNAIRTLRHTPKSNSKL